MSIQNIMLQQTDNNYEDEETKSDVLNISIPDHWQFVKLGDVLREVDIRAEELKIVESEEIPVLSLTKNRGLIPQSERFNNRVATQVISNYKVINKGQIVYNPFVLWEGAIYALRGHEQGLVSPVYLVWEVTNADNFFLDYLLRTPQLLNEYLRVASGVVQRRRAVRKDVFLNIRIPFPPHSEQQAIAHVLQTIQETIQVRQIELKLERERKAALIDYLFTYGTRGETTKQTDIGEIPESWEIVHLRDLCVHNLGLIQTGPFGSQLHASDYKDQGIPVVNPTHLGINTIVEDSLPLISREDADRLSKHYLMEGDVLISRRGDFSRYSYITAKQAGWLCGTGCLLIRLNNSKIENQFFAISIGTDDIQSYFAYTATGTIMPNLNTKILEGIPVTLPPTRDEQHLIVNIWNACSSKITAMEKEVTLLEELFRSILEELMTGRLSTLTLIEKGETHE
jgi:type I restriction enzyme, S subunit